jgi:SAM-dependent methyltransferase
VHHNGIVTTPRDEPAPEFLARHGFTDGQRYAGSRPDYPADAVAHLSEALGLPNRDLVVDVGAGTGIFTRQIAPSCRRVVAVEPSAGMRESFRSASDLEVVDGRDTELPFPDGSVGAITVAQAFHWFDPVASLAEFARVLEPDGALGLIWNERDESVPWVAALSRAIGWGDRQPYPVGRDFTDVLERGGFAGVERRTFTHVQHLDRAGLDRRVLSTSYVAVMDEPGQRAILDAVAEVLDDLGDRFDLPYVTTTYCAPRPR